MDTKTFGAIRRVVAVARKANKEADTFERQGFKDAAVITDAYAMGVMAALRAALYGETNADVRS